MTLEVNLDRVQKRVEALFKKEERVRQGAEAMLEYKAEARVVREKTARLRTLRLAKELAETEARHIQTTPRVDKKTRSK
jgi:hypothetical protein